MIHKAMTQPEPPASLPKYFADGIPKQDVNTLRDVCEYVEALVEYREQPVEVDELPVTAELVDRGDSELTSEYLGKP